MNYSIKVCDFCDTCVYEGEYVIREGEVVCFMCIRDEEDSEIEIEPPNYFSSAV
jgi:formylmethanofuran dehydrogenase subunit E